MTIGKYNIYKISLRTEQTTAEGFMDYRVP